MIWKIWKQKTTNQNNKKEKNKKNKDRVSSLWDNFKCSNICIIGVPEGEEKKQEVGTTSKKIVKEKFPNLVKEIGKSRKHRESTQRPTPRHIIVKMPKVEDRERLFKAAGEKKTVTRWLTDGSGRGEGVKR